MSNASHSALLRSALLPGLLAGLLTIAGCGGPSEEKLLASAREHQAKGQIEAAKLETKSALQANPQSSSGRLLLGKLLLASGDPAGAEAELLRALELGQPELAVLPTLAEALVSLQKGRQLLLQAYTLPMLFIADARVDGNGKFRFQFSREDVPVTNRLRFSMMINTDKEYMAGLRYILTKYFSLSSHYDSDMGLGAGITLTY